MNETATLAIEDALRASEGSLRTDRDQRLNTPRISLARAAREQNGSEDGRDGRRSNGRGTGRGPSDPMKAPGVEKPERFFGRRC